MHVVLRLCQSVVGEPQIRSCLNQSRPPQVREMAGNCGLGQTQEGDDIAHAELTGGERTQNADTCGIGKAFKQTVEVDESWAPDARGHRYAHIGIKYG